jgi:hypothetical protein
MFREFTGATRGLVRAKAAPKHRSIASVELITTAALALSTVVALTAVSIGIARADVAGSVVAKGGGASIAIAIFIGLFLSGMGGLTAMMTSDNRGRE